MQVMYISREFAYVVSSIRMTNESVENLLKKQMIHKAIHTYVPIELRL